MSKENLARLLELMRKDPALQCAVTSAKTFPDLSRTLRQVGKAHGIEIDAEDVEHAVTELARIKKSASVGFTPEQEKLVFGTLASICWDFPPTTDWTNVATAGNNPCCSYTTTESA